MPNGEMEVIEDGGTAIRPAAQSKLLAQQQRYKDHLARLVSSLAGVGAPTDFNQLAALLRDAEQAARNEITRAILY